MQRINAYATPEYPVLLSVLPAGEAEESVPDGHAGISLALLVDGMPTFLATHVVDDGSVDRVVSSLEEGDVRLAVIGLLVELDEDVPALGLRATEEHPAAVVSVVCADGLRLTVARILGTDRDQSPNRLARHIVREITRGVQIPDLAGTP